MIVNVDEDPVLISLKNGKLLPFYGIALRFADGWTWSVKSKYSGATLICKNGSIFTISEVKIKKPLGKSFPSQLFSFFNLNWEISLNLNLIENSLDEIKNTIIKGICLERKNSYKEFETSMDPFLISKIEKANSCEEIFKYLGLSCESELDLICGYNL